MQTFTPRIGITQDAAVIDASCLASLTEDVLSGPYGHVIAFSSGLVFSRRASLRSDTMVLLGLPMLCNSRCYVMDAGSAPCMTARYLVLKVLVIQLHLVLQTNSRP